MIFLILQKIIIYLCKFVSSPLHQARTKKWDRYLICCILIRLSNILLLHKKISADKKILAIDFKQVYKTSMTVLNNMKPGTKKRYEFKLHGWVGIFLILLAELGVIFQHDSYIAHRIGVWTTPLCWWGYIFF